MSDTCFANQLFSHPLRNKRPRPFDAGGQSFSSTTDRDTRTRLDHLVRLIGNGIAAEVKPKRSRGIDGTAMLGEALSRITTDGEDRTMTVNSAHQHRAGAEPKSEGVHYNHVVATSQRILRLAEVLAMVGLGRRTLY